MTTWQGFNNKLTYMYSQDTLTINCASILMESIYIASLPNFPHQLCTTNNCHINLLLQHVSHLLQIMFR